MSGAMKSIYATITNHVQMVGYREVVEAHGRARGLAGFVFNDVDGSVKVMASGLEPVLNEFIHDLKIICPDTAIETKEIKEDIRLPSPFGKIAVDDVLEYMARFDKGIGILTEHTTLLKDQSSTLTEQTALLKENTQVLHSMKEKLDTLPERIAEALKK
ncbi:MAG: acylphosphatase [Methanosarcinales archaeon]|nr:acylphosphatase [Methanosarcinales archaeon]